MNQGLNLTFILRLKLSLKLLIASGTRILAIVNWSNDFIGTMILI